MSARRMTLLDDPNTVLDRHRDLFNESPLRRASALAAPLGIAGVAIFAGWWLAIPFDQIGPGLASLAKFVALMFPPSAGGHLHLNRRRACDVEGEDPGRHVGIGDPTESGSRAPYQGTLLNGVAVQRLVERSLIARQIRSPLCEGRVDAAKE